MSDVFKPGLGKQRQMGLCEFEARVSQTNKSTTKCFLRKQKHQLWVGWRCSLVGRALALITHRASVLHTLSWAVCVYNLSTGWGRQDSRKSEANLVYAVSPRWSELVTKQDPVSKIKRSTLVFRSIQHMMMQPASSSEQELVDLAKSSFYRSQTSSWREGIFTTSYRRWQLHLLPVLFKDTAGCG